MRASVLALAARRGKIARATRRRASGWAFTGTTYLASDGASGSYAEAATNAAARVFLPGSVLGTGTFVCWVRKSAAAVAYIMYSHASGGAIVGLLISTASSGTMRGIISDDAASTLLASHTGIGAELDGVTWSLCAVRVVHDSSDVLTSRFEGAGTDATDGTPGAYAAATGMRLFATPSNTSRLAGDIRSPAVFSRALSDAELAELHALGPTHDLRVASGDYSGGGPAHWWPGDGDSGTTVTDRGSVGGCNLTLNGGVTLEAA